MPASIDITATVQRCCTAYYTALAQEQAKKDVLQRDAYRPHTEFRRHLPFLSDADHIRAFIACVAQGMVIGTIIPKDGAKLLYAAQCARSALPRETHPAGRPKTIPTPTPTPSPSTGCPGSLALGDPGVISPIGLTPTTPAINQKITPTPSPSTGAPGPSPLGTGERSSHRNRTPATLDRKAIDAIVMRITNDLPDPESDASATPGLPANRSTAGCPGPLALADPGVISPTGLSPVTPTVNQKINTTPSPSKSPNPPSDLTAYASQVIQRAMQRA